MKKALILSMLTASILISADMDTLKEQLKMQHQNISLLQNRLENLEQVTNKRASKSSFAQKDFIPDISLIGDFSYVHRDKETTHLSLPGFTHSHGEESTHAHSHAHLNEKEGFNLNYAELVLQSTVDPYVDMMGVFHLSEDNFEIEELYINSRGLPFSLGLKVGKFFSNFGRLNSKHHHVWNFADQPLIHNALIGEHGINEKGIALNWIAPTPFYLDIGLEVLKGENELSFGDEAISLSEEVGIKSADAPNLKIVYAKLGIDIGDTALLAGISYANSKARIDHLSDEEPHAFAGDSKLYGMDLTLKKPLGAYSDLTWTTELIKRDLDGIKYVPSTNKDEWSKKLSSSKEQSGLYSSLIYKLDNEWRMGFRYDDIFQNDVIANGVNKNKPEDLNRYSAMLEYNFSEFNRIRLQYNKDNSKFNEEGNKVKNDEIILQVNISIGSHGAHNF